MNFQLSLLQEDHHSSNSVAGWRKHSFLRPWRERMYAARCCRSLFHFHAHAVLSKPALRGIPLYIHVVRAYLDCDESSAAMLIEHAAESYANWPEPRDVRFRDVARYIVATGLCQEPGGHGWVGIDLYPVITRWLPSEW
jgi:hypothetical protein